ncbi:hypothetical protein KDA_53900 [Dictyobacter alpinus]|uniref:DUF2249 domain-containing protein n=1 Tax=Dictyobacter alpinus TaxID=2014873 RepID=A0A402BF29_9CHLR|nr:DUF2249 domain-containing protein [Dictyobacter alpinus]GCE29906.1 hypothetical protein KDA_53900 [Dictyobacter alpinus]
MISHVDQWKIDAQTVLDVRPQLERGEEPFISIMEAASTIAVDQTLLIIAPFEPVPLYSAMAQRSFSHETEEVSPTEWVVRFFKHS